MRQKNSKRILSVTVRRIQDEDGDTSWLGEYANQASSEYSIDRQHSLECSVNDPIGKAQAEATIDQLERVIAYLDAQRIEQADILIDGRPNSFYDSLSDAQDILIERQDMLREPCDCDERGDRERNEYRYFNPSFNYVDKFGAALPENTPAEVVEYVRQDYGRMESLNRGSWCFVGVRADAQVQLTGDLTQKLTSGGLWSIESDSGDYFEEVEEEQLAELRTELEAIGFSKRAVSAAFRNIEHKDC